MIRVNLLDVERERPKRRAVGLTMAQRVTLACSVILVLTAAGIGWWYWSLQQRGAQLDREILAAEQETQRLRSVLSQVQAFETQRVQLQQRVALIEELQRDRSAPVHMLDEISKSVPDRLWLTQLEQVDNVLTIEGRTTVLTALSDFVAGLESSGYFRRPVEIVSSQVENQQSADLVRFTVKAEFVRP
jgi:type IV pilus assembly protein PilN